MGNLPRRYQDDLPGPHSSRCRFLEVVQFNVPLVHPPRKQTISETQPPYDLGGPRNAIGTFPSLEPLQDAIQLQFIAYSHVAILGSFIYRRRDILFDESESMESPHHLETRRDCGVFNCFTSYPTLRRPSTPWRLYPGTGGPHTYPKGDYFRGR